MLSGKRAALVAAALAAWFSSGTSAAGPAADRSASADRFRALVQAGAAGPIRSAQQNALSPLIPIAFGAHDEADPAVAYNPERDEYLVIWDDDTLNAIRGVILNPDGTIKAEPFFVIPPAPGGADIHDMTLLYHPGVQRMYAFGIREEPGGSRVIGVAQNSSRDFGDVINLTNPGIYLLVYALARPTDSNLDLLFTCVLVGVANIFRLRLGPTLQPIGSPIQTTFFNSPPGVGSFSGQAVPSGTLLGVVGPNAIFGGIIGGILLNLEPFLSPPLRIALACLALFGTRGPDSCAAFSSDVDGRIYFQDMTSAGALNGPNRLLLETGFADPEHAPLVQSLSDQYLLVFQDLQGATQLSVLDSTGTPGDLRQILSPNFFRIFNRSISRRPIKPEIIILVTAKIVGRRDADSDVLLRTLDLDPGAGFDPSMLVSMDRGAYAQSDTVDLMITYGRGSVAASADAYLLLQLPDGTFLFGPDLSPTPQKHRNNFIVQDEIDPLRVKGLAIAGLPAGQYTWYWGLTRPGTLELIGGIGSRGFSVAAR